LFLQHINLISSISYSGVGTTCPSGAPEFIWYLLFIIVE